MDARAVYASDSQVTDDIYMTSYSSRDVIGISYPTKGYIVWISARYNYGSGVILDNYLFYDTPDFDDLLGASANYPSSGGDSGGPIYRTSGSSSAYAVGIHSTGTGAKEFARVWDLPGRMGAQVMS